MSTWRKLLTEEFGYTGDTWADVVSCTLTDEELDVEFNDRSWGGENGKPFTLWTHKWVYFPTTYDGREEVAFVSRHPDGKPTGHIGER